MVPGGQNGGWLASDTTYAAVLEMFHGEEMWVQGHAGRLDQSAAWTAGRFSTVVSPRTKLNKRGWSRHDGEQVNIAITFHTEPVWQRDLTIGERTTAGNVFRGFSSLGSGTGSLTIRRPGEMARSSITDTDLKTTRRVA